jgi:aspartate aminotransferase
MFESLQPLPQDPILGLMTAFRADTAQQKVDLGVGVYRDDRGATPIMSVVKEAESNLLVQQQTKSYVGPTGSSEFNTAMEALVFGAQHPALRAGRIRSVQAPGGCGALRLAAELIRVVAPGASVYVSTPTWANHVPLIGGAGLKIEHYPYYSPKTGGVDFGAACAALEGIPEGSVVLLHASCHNPTGADFSQTQWRELLTIFARRQLLPFLDLAYQGMGTHLDEDAFSLRLFTEQLPEALVAVSCSKNFGLYRERVGSLHVLGEAPQVADAMLKHLGRIARTLYSMPPDHGAAVVAQILTDPKLRTRWEAEVGQMRERVNGLRQAVVVQLQRVCPQRDFSFIASQKGMFSFLGLSVSEVKELRERHHVYMTDDSRINIAGLNAENLPYFAAAVSAVVR